MPITLTLTQVGTRAGKTGDASERRAFATGTLSIGRSASNDWVLPDPEQHLSRTHCMIASEDGRYVLTDLSTNGMLINGAREPTQRNSRVVLTDGDTVQLGGYLITVAEDFSGFADSRPDAFGSPSFGSKSRAPAANPFLGADPFGAPSGGPVGGRGGDHPLDIDPLDDPLGNPLADQIPGRGSFQHPLPHVPRPTARGDDPFDVADRKQGDRNAGVDDSLFPGARLDADAVPDAWAEPVQPASAEIARQAFSAPKPLFPPPFAGPAAGVPNSAAPSAGSPNAGGPNASSPNASSPNASSPNASSPNASSPGEIDFDALLGDDMPVAAPHPLAPPPQASPAAAPPAPAPSALSCSLDDLLGEEPPAPQLPAAPPAAPPDPFANPSPASSAPPAARAAPAEKSAPPPAERGPSPLNAPAAAGGDEEGILAAFLEGAGLEGVGIARLNLLGGNLAGGGGNAKPRDAKAAMRDIGALFRALVAGARETLMSRAEVKHELRVEQTMLRARDNNALKFSVTPEEALAALLLPGRPGYKAPLASVEEAFEDIRGHEMAVMAGLQTALIGLLKRFDPDALEGRMRAGALDAVLPGTRKARYWDLFRATYKDIAREAEDDFHSVFGREFARAYDAQIGRQQAAREGAPAVNSANPAAPPKS